MTYRALSIPILLCLLAAACNKKVSASNEFKQAQAEFKPALAKLQAEFPAHERELQALRDQDPAKAARKIEQDVLPLIDAVAAALEKAHAAGVKYIAAATDEDPDMIAKLRTNIEQLGRQGQGFARLRDAYADQAKRLARGKLTEADTVAFVTAVKDAMKLVQ